MEWYDKEDNIFEDCNESLTHTNHFDIENFLMKSHNNNDFEIQIDDLVYENISNHKPILSFIQKENSRKEEINSKVTEEKIFQIKKVKRRRKSKDQINSKLNTDIKAQMSNHPFLNTNLSLDNAKTENSTDKNTLIEQYSTGNDQECAELSSQTTNQEFPDNESLINNNSCIIEMKRNLNNCEGQYYCIPLNQLSISERMKIKKEKAKQLLEKKTKRDSFCFSVNLTTHDTHSPTNRESKSESNFQDSSMSSNIHNETFSNNYLSKKESKMLRNRVSAQRSRDRKKKEYDDLKVIAQKLMDENLKLKKQIEHRDNQISEIKHNMDKLCKSCEQYVKVNIHDRENECYTINDMYRNKLSLSSNRLKYSLMTGLLVVVCLIGVMATNMNNLDYNQLRNLSSVKENIINMTEKEKESLNPSTGIVIYDKPTFKVEKVDKSKPFIITKEPKKTYGELDYLNIKRENFVTKFERMNTRTGFLQPKLVNQCINADILSVGVLHEQDKNENFEEDITLDNSSLLDNRINHDEFSLKEVGVNLDGDHLRKQVVPLQTNTKFDSTKSMLGKNIKSMYCRDFITSAGENSELFKDLFKKLDLENEKIQHEEFESTDNFKEVKSEDDCMYLHMIVPSHSMIEDHKVFYEVGCKVFEINKIYK